MGIFDGCLLISDIDGTLLHNGKIPQNNIEAINWFKSEGGIFALATGRTVIASKYSYELSRSNAPLIAIHGGIIYDFENQKLLYHSILDERVKLILPKIMERFPEVGTEIFSGLKFYELRSNNSTQWHAEYEALSFEPLPDDINSIPWTKVLFGINDEKTLDELKEYCGELNVDFCRFVTTSNKENARYYEILPTNVNKGNALKEMKCLMGASKAYGIGDFYNDVELIVDADIGATTAEAPEDIKKLANYVTCACEDGAVADFINKISLEMKGSKVWTR